jgi:hypothetical protein
MKRRPQAAAALSRGLSLAGQRGQIGVQGDLVFRPLGFKGSAAPIYAGPDIRLAYCPPDSLWRQEENLRGAK